MHCVTRRRCWPKKLEHQRFARTLPIQTDRPDGPEGPEHPQFTPTTARSVSIIGVPRLLAVVVTVCADCAIRFSCAVQHWGNMAGLASPVALRPVPSTAEHPFSRLPSSLSPASRLLKETSF